MAFHRLTPGHTGSVNLSNEQESVLACVEAGLGRAATCESTGLDPDRVEKVVQGLVDLCVLPASSTCPSPAEGDDDADLADGGELPLGIEPWRGDAMPEGTASSHDLHAPSTGDRDPGSVSSFPPRRSRPPPLDEVNYRRVYEVHFREMEVGEREDAARHVTGNELFALCLDPAPQVVAALLDNTHFGLDHARLVALHHKNSQGLEILARRSQLVRDAHVQRRLLQNLQTPESVLERIVRFKRLIEIYRLSIDKDLPERNRMRVRTRLRPNFTNAEPEDRAALIIKTEGRCLIYMTGCTFDAKTTQILCNQSFSSTLFIQNLARFPATPPVLLAKLLRSPVVQRQPQLRALLMRHGNVSSELKRRG